MRALIFITITGLLVASPPVLGDPTRPPTPAEIRAWQSGESSEDTQSGWQLQSVLVSEDRRVAIINGRRHHTGDRIGAARITAINPGEVTLEQAGEHFSLTIANRTHGVRRTPND